MNRISNNPSIYPHDYEAMESEQPAPNSSGQPTATSTQESAKGARAAVGKRRREDGSVPAPRTPPSLRLAIPGPAPLLPDGYTSPGRTHFTHGGDVLTTRAGIVLYVSGNKERGILSDGVAAGGSGFRLKQPEAIHMGNDRKEPLGQLVDRRKGLRNLGAAGRAINQENLFTDIRKRYFKEQPPTGGEHPGTGTLLSDGSYESSGETRYTHGGPDLTTRAGTVLYVSGNKERGILSDGVAARRSGFPLLVPPGTHNMIDDRKESLGQLVDRKKGFQNLGAAGRAINQENFFRNVRSTYFKEQPTANADRAGTGTLLSDGSYESSGETRYTHGGPDLTTRAGIVLYVSDNKERGILSDDVEARNSGFRLRVPRGTPMEDSRRKPLERLVDPGTGFPDLTAAGRAIGSENFFRYTRTTLKRLSQATQASEPQAEGGKRRQRKTRQRRGLPKPDTVQRREELSPALAQAHMHSPMDPETRQELEGLQKKLNTGSPGERQQLMEELSPKNLQQLRQLEEQQLRELLGPVRDSLAIGEADNAGPLGHLEAMSPSWEEDLWGAHAASRTAEGVAGDILGMHDEGLDSHAIAGQIAGDLDFALDPALVQATIEVNRTSAPAAAGESSAAGQARGGTAASSRTELVRRHKAQVLIHLQFDLTDNEIRKHVPELTLDEIERIREEWKNEQSMVW